MCAKCPEDQWPNWEGRHCIPKTLDCLSYRERLGTALAVCTPLLFPCPGHFRTLHLAPPHPPHPSQQPPAQLSPTVLLGPLFPLPLCVHWSSRDSHLCCMPGSSWGHLSQSVLAKTIVVVAAFHTTWPHTWIRKWMGPVLPSTIPVVLVQATLCTLWVTRWPPRPVNSTEPGSPGTVKCDEGSLELFYAMLGYLGLIGLVSLLVTFPACRLPDTVNEAKHIGLSMLVCSCVWVSFIPAHVSAQGKGTVAGVVFAILASGASLLSCLFFPKCYISLLHPEKNAKEQMLVSHHLK